MTIFDVHYAQHIFAYHGYHESASLGENRPKNRRYRRSHARADEPKKEETSDVDENFEPYTPKIRKSGTGCVYQINDTLWEGSFYPRMPNGKRKKFNVYAKTREECEKLLAEMTAEKKAEIAEMKKKMKTA